MKRTVVAMNTAFPFAIVESYEDLISSIELPDADDRHVLAAGIKCNAKLIITFNLKDFPNAYLDKFGLKAIDPDLFISNLYNNDSALAEQAFFNQLKSLKRPPKTRGELVEILRKCGLNTSSKLFS